MTSVVVETLRQDGSELGRYKDWVVKESRHRARIRDDRGHVLAETRNHDSKEAAILALLTEVATRLFVPKEQP